MLQHGREIILVKPDQREITMVTQMFQVILGTLISSMTFQNLRKLTSVYLISISENQIGLLTNTKF